MEHFLPADPVIPIQPPLSLSLWNLNRPSRLGWRITNDSQVCVQRSKAFWKMDKGKSSDMNEFMRGVKFKGPLC